MRKLEQPFKARVNRAAKGERLPDPGGRLIEAKEGGALSSQSADLRLSIQAAEVFGGGAKAGAVVGTDLTNAETGDEPAGGGLRRTENNEGEIRGRHQIGNAGGEAEARQLGPVVMVIQRAGRNDGEGIGPELPQEFGLGEKPAAENAVGGQRFVAVVQPGSAAVAEPIDGQAGSFKSGSESIEPALAPHIAEQHAGGRSEQCRIRLRGGGGDQGRIDEGRKQVEGARVFGRIGRADFGGDAEAQPGFAERFVEKVVGNAAPADIVVVHHINAEGGAVEVAERASGDEVVREERDAKNAANRRALQRVEQAGAAFPAGETGVGNPQAPGTEGLHAAEGIVGAERENVRFAGKDPAEQRADAVLFVHLVRGDDGGGGGQGGAG